MKILLLKLSIISLLITFASSFYHAVNENRFEQPNCNQIETNRCGLMVITGGFPKPYIYDNPNIDGKNYLTIKDNIVVGNLFQNWVIYFAIISFLSWLIRFKLFVSLLKAFILGLFLTLLSSQYQRPSQESFPSPFDCQLPPCSKIKVLTGGYPFRYIYDNPGVSVRNSLSIEDDWRVKPFMYNLLIYFFVAFIGLKLIGWGIKNFRINML